MKILMVNKFFYIKGGSETYYFALKKLLEENGHTVIDFAMKDEKNFESKYSNYFVDAVDYNKKMSLMNKIKVGKEAIYSNEAKRKFEKLIIDTKPDIIHLNIFQHQLSLSILDVIKKYNIPTVYTAHELQMICPNYRMLTHGRVCEECKTGKYFNCVKNKCIKDSFSKSTLGMIEAYYVKNKHKYDVIDKIITPSDFYKRKFIEFGVDENRVIHLPNFLDRKTPIVGKNEYGEYFLYFGRLSEEKGILTLIKAIEQTKSKLLIVGTGSLKEQLENYIDKNKLSRQIRLLGFKSGQELIDIVGNSKAVVLPSEWYENGPYSAIEALQLGRLIIGSNIGGIPELIKNNGFTFEMGNVEDLKSKIIEVSDEKDEELKRQQNNSIEIFRKNYDKEKYYQQIMKIYKDIIK